MRSFSARASSARAGLAGLWLMAVCGIGLAQDAVPSAQEMVEALKPRSRSLRNLIVGEAAASAAAGASAAGEAGTAPTGGAVAPAYEPAAPKPSLSIAIRFDFDSARLRPEGAGVLDRLAAALQAQELKDSRFLIEGHTDAKGGADYNLRLSQLRADEVLRYLTAHGVAGQRLSAVGHGSRQPANPGSPLAAENRRVRIVNLE
jgi:outer membrane protein OmpA-like peptidoglycan-associated protein